nr:hypothetical protein [Tanacetum cinerariifolium]
MRRVGKGFSGRITDLFPSMLTQKPRKPKRKNTQVPQPSGSTEQVIDEAVYKELDDTLVMDATIASSLDVEQDSGNIDKTQSKTTPNEASSPGTTSGGGPRVLDLEKTKTTQALEIDSLKRRVKKLKKKQRSRTQSSKDYTSYCADEDITLVNDQDDAKMFDVSDLQGEEVFVDIEVDDKEVNDEENHEVQEVVEDINTATLIVDAAHVNVASITTTDSAAATITTEEITLAQALVEIKTTKLKAKELVLQEPSESSTTTTTVLKQNHKIRENILWLKNL